MASLELRCKGCKKLLAKVDYGKVEVKCPGCNTINQVNVTSQKYLLTSSKA